MKVIATHFGDHDISWLLEYSDGDYVLYDRSNTGLPNAIKRENIGDADYDKLSYIVDNYENLPDMFLLTKSNLFKFITLEEWDILKYKTEFTPILTQYHKTYEPICHYENGVYCELNNSWYLHSVPAAHFNSYNEFASAFNLPNPDYLKFAPGGSYIVTRERIHRYPKVFYELLRDLLPWSIKPGEAQIIERTYYQLWS